MRKNGTISIAHISSGGIDEFGELTDETIVWSEPIDCFVSTNRDNRIGAYEDGEFRMSAYNVLMEYSKETLDAVTDKSGKVSVGRVSLTRIGSKLGEFRIQSIEEFPNVGRITLFAV